MLLSFVIEVRFHVSENQQLSFIILSKSATYGIKASDALFTATETFFGILMKFLLNDEEEFSLLTNFNKKSASL
jgi:hypothetical protein